jgi:hypothetical protein
MYFPHQFKRSVVTGGFPTLGTADSAPSGSATTGTNSPYGSYPSQNSSGIAIKSLLVGFSCTASTNNVSANVYLYDDTSQLWLLWTSAVALVANTVTSIAVPTPVSARPSVPASSLSNYQFQQPGGVPQSVDYYLFVSANGSGNANGIYTFDVCPSLS